ncbi:hypothetical protein GPECTOR_12g481 [Gonium pectorale]|uniref:Protein kinase domain-containing protein n=1 Tax=Gonium pectorale TaxID=33097 RepID=A0A150GP51_GONPE|nr:hypothetical protein GPECTOR_12g481 [Gonium pectorale]|eukprot:KXZ51518.1 hypothetical protein GPECTOR_12g481 [Gonium pectorale]
MQRVSLDCTPPAPKSTGEGFLLAVNPGVPAAMRRHRWSLQDYIVSRRLYKGSTSAVYKATCRFSGAQVALKVYFLSRVPANVLHMILREIKIHTELVHDNIIALHAAFQEERRLVLVQEFAARGDLHEIFRAMERPITETELASLVLTPFLDALCHLHSKGICHRDIKPENILLTQDWRCVIADFGVSVDLAEERAVTRAGTLEYMAPEVERCPLKMYPNENKEKSHLAYTTAVDIWATGVLAYELLIGFPPFRVDGAAPSAPSAARGPLHFPHSVSAVARDFIRAALADHPEDRPTAFELRQHPWLAAAANANGSRD